MGDTADEVTGRFQPLGQTESDTGTGAYAGRGATPLDDTAADGSFDNPMAGAAFAEAQTGLPASETTMSAPYSEGIGADPYGERTGAFVEEYDTASIDTSDVDDVEQDRLEIERTRAEMSDTIDAIQDKLSPANIAQQAKETVRDATIGKAQDMVSNVGDTATNAVSNVGETARGASSSLIDTIKQNPVPAALTGIGLGWLFVSMRKNSASSTDYGSSAYSAPYGYSSGYSSGNDSGGQGVTDRAGDMAGRAQSKVSDVAGQAQNKVSDVAGQAQQSVSQAGSQVQGAVSESYSQAQDAAGRAGDTFQGWMQENPLAVGAAALALGVAAGLAVPGTQKEDELLGPTRDNLAQKAQDAVQDTAQKVQTVAQEAVSAGKQEAQDQNLM